MNTSRKHNRPGRRQTERERAPASDLKDGKGHKQGVFIHRMLSLQTEDSASHRDLELLGNCLRKGDPGQKCLLRARLPCSLPQMCPQEVQMGYSAVTLTEQNNEIYMKIVIIDRVCEIHYTC